MEYFTTGHDNIQQNGREPLRRKWAVGDYRQASFKTKLVELYPDNHYNEVGLIVPSVDKAQLLQKLLKQPDQITQATDLLTNPTRPVLHFSNDQVDNTPDHVTVVNYRTEGLLLISDQTSIEESSIRPATPIQGGGPVSNSIIAEQVDEGPSERVGGPGENIHDAATPVRSSNMANLSMQMRAPTSESTPQSYSGTFGMGPHINQTARLAQQPTLAKTEIKQDMSTNVNVAHPNLSDLNPRHEYTRPLQPGKLMITLPSFNPQSDSIEEVLAKLQKVIPLYGNPEAQRMATPTIIFNFLQASNLDHLILNLTADQLNDFTQFKEAMLKRYARVSPATDFYITNQSIGELEADLMARLTRMWQRIKRTATLDDGDKLVIRERFLSALRDPAIRLKLRESNATFEELPDLARRLRSAREVEDSQPSTINLMYEIKTLREEVEKLRFRTPCSKCGLGHDESECRANSKQKAQHNKSVRFGRTPRPNRDFAIPSDNSKNPRGRPRGGNQQRGRGDRARGNRPYRGRGLGRSPGPRPRTPEDYRRDRSRSGDRGYIRDRTPSPYRRNYLVEHEFF